MSKTLTTSVAFTDAQNNVLANGKVVFQLNMGAKLITNGQIVNVVTIPFTLDATGKLPAGQTINANDELMPVGTFYVVTIFNSNGLLVRGPENWILLGTSPIDISTITSSSIPDPGLANPIIGNPSAPQTITGQSLTLTSSAPFIAQGSATFTGALSASNVTTLQISGPKPWIDVTSSPYGAKGDGVTDDAAAIQAAINTLPIPGGGKIFFPCGKYLVKSTLLIPLNSNSYIMGESQGCSQIIKDFDSTSLFRSANSTYGTQTTLSANANLGDQRLTVTSSAGFAAGDWIQLDDNTGITAGNCTSYTAYEPAALSCNIGIYQIRSVPDGTHIDIRTSLDEAYTTAGLARVSKITPFTASFHDLYFSHGPDCGTPNACTGRFIDLIFPIESELQHLTMDTGRLIAIVQLHRGKHIKYHDCIIRNGDDSLTKNGLGANSVIFDEATSYFEFGPNNNLYKVGETVAQGQAHHGEFHHNTFHGCADSCINTHGSKNHDISMSYNVMGGGASADTQNTVSARCIVVSDTDFNINIDNNICRNWVTAGIQVVATTQFSISNISIRNNQLFSPMTSTGVFPPNYFLSTSTNPPVAVNVSGVDNPKIMGNHIAGAFPANSVGLQVISSRRGQLIGNHVIQTATVSGDIGIYHITNAAQPSSQMMLVGNIVSGWNSSNCRFDLGPSTFAGLNLIGNDCATGPAGTYVYGAGITSIERIGNVGEGLVLPETAAPTGVVSSDIYWGDLTTHTPSWNNNNNGISSPSGAWVAINVTPVTVNANVSTDQNLMSISVPAGTLNRVGRTLRIWLAGVYSTPAASSTAVVIKAKLGSLTLATWTSTALAGIQATNDQFNVTAWATTQTAGATAAFEVHGNLDIDLGIGNTVADSNFADVNTATVSSVDSTATQTLQITVAFTVASASNSATQRQLILETIN